MLKSTEKNETIAKAALKSTIPSGLSESIHLVVSKLIDEVTILITITSCFFLCIIDIIWKVWTDSPPLFPKLY